MKDDGKINKQYLEKFEDAIADDMDMPKAVATLWNLLRDENANGKVKTIEKMDSVFGLNLLEKQEIEIPEAVRKLIEQRQQARENKDWDKADELREEIEKMGIEIKDDAV